MSWRAPFLGQDEPHDKAPGRTPHLSGPALAIPEVVVHNGLGRWWEVRRRGPRVLAAAPEGALDALRPDELLAVNVDDLAQGPFSGPGGGALP